METTMEVFVTNVFGRSVVCLVDETWTVQQLKDTYAHEFETCCTNNWYLMFNGKFLQNQKLLVDYDVGHGSIIHVTYRLAHRMTRPVELKIIYHEFSSREGETSSRRSSDASNVSSDRKTFLMYAEADWSVGRVKREFAQLREIMDWKSLKVLSGGMCLREKYLLEDYHIQNDATLHFEHNIRPRKFGITALKRFITTNTFLSFKIF